MLLNNINGTGRTLEFLINTNNNNKEFVLSTSDKFFINNKVNHGYSINYKENDFSKSQSYKLNTLTLDTNFNYVFSDNTNHKFGIGYSLKDYQAQLTQHLLHAIDFRLPLVLVRCLLQML